MASNRPELTPHQANVLKAAQAVKASGERVTDRAIAAKLGVSHTAVSVHRRVLTEMGQWPHQDGKAAKVEAARQAMLEVGRRCEREGIPHTTTNCARLANRSGRRTRELINILRGEGLWAYTIPPREKKPRVRKPHVKVVREPKPPKPRKSRKKVLTPKQERLKLIKVLHRDLRASRKKHFAPTMEIWRRRAGALINPM